MNIYESIFMAFIPKIHFIPSEFFRKKDLLIKHYSQIHIHPKFTKKKSVREINFIKIHV